MNVLHFLLAFAADLVTLPEAGDFLSMVLMTPKPLSASCPTWQKGMKEEQRMRFLERGTKGNAPEAVIPQREEVRLSSCGWVRFLTHPPGGHSEKVSRQRALLGTICTMATLPVFRVLGLCLPFLS